MTAPLAIVLAAGKSTRMKSQTPKVLHDVCGRLMIDHVLGAVREAGVTKTVVVVGHQAERVKETLAHHDDVAFALQAEQKGTGHAVMVCDAHLEGHTGPVLVLAGDTPLLEGESLSRLIDEMRERNAACVIGTAITANNAGLGRVVRDESGEFVGIVEHKDATEEQLKIEEINTGCYAFDGPKLRSVLHRIKPENSQAEYYLTDCPTILQDDGETVAALASLTIEEAMGVNTRVQLAEVTRVIQQRIQSELMTSGVTIVQPESTFVDITATVGNDSTLLPGTVIGAGVTIGSGCTIGPHVHVTTGRTIADGETVTG